MEIGNWVRRQQSATATLTVAIPSKWHRVESVVAGAAITRCGKRMEPLLANGKTLQVVQTEPLTRMIGQPQNCAA